MPGEIDGIIAKLERAWALSGECVTVATGDGDVLDYLEDVDPDMVGYVLSAMTARCVSVNKIVDVARAGPHTEQCSAATRLWDRPCTCWRAEFDELVARGDANGVTGHG